jgi:transcriptional regulator with XRE-family HTH domain
MAKRKSSKVDRIRAFERGMLRSEVMSLFWAVISDRRERMGFKLQSLADTLGIDKSGVSRWFSSRPNWRLNTVADIAYALNLELRITAIDCETGTVFSPSGPISDQSPDLSTIETEGLPRPAKELMVTSERSKYRVMYTRTPPGQNLKVA